MESTTLIQQPLHIKIPSDCHTSPGDKYFNATPGQLYKAAYIDNKAYRASIENYLLYVDLYNAELLKYNAAVDDYNAQVTDHHENHGLSDIQKIYANLFAFKNWNKPPKLSQQQWKSNAYNPTKAHKITPRNTYDYNQLVQQFNDSYGMVFPKIKPQPIKNQTKDIFETVLHWYQGAIGQYTTTCLSSTVIDEYPLVPLQWNNYNLANSKRNNGARNTNLTSRTIATHRNRLIEAGVLIDGVYHGSKAPMTAYINPEILVVFDPELSRKRIAENQQVNTDFKKKLLDRYVSTYLLDNNKDKDNKDSPMAHNSIDKNLPTTAQTPKSETGHRAPDVKKTAHIPQNERESNKKRTAIIAPVKLAQEIERCEHNDTPALKPHELHKEAVSGTLNREEFAQFLAQHLIKQFCVLWNDKNVHTGSWINAIKLVMKHFFKHHGRYVSKLVMIDHYYAHLERLKQVKSYCIKHPDYDLRYPSVYFNPVNNTKSTGGYAVTHKWFLKLLKDRESSRDIADKALDNRKRKEYRNSRRTKMVTITRKYLRGKIDEAQLFNHVSMNLAEYKSQIHEFVDQQRQFIEKE